MAINFLNSIDFNQNELLHPRIENQANDTNAGTSVDGQLYFNTTSNILKVSDGSGGWKEVGGGVETLTAAQGTFISFTAATSATGDVDLGTFDLSAIDGSSDTTTRFLSKDNTWDIPSYTTVTTTDGTYINLTPNSATSGAVTVTADLSAIDGVAAVGERYLTKNNTWAEVATIPGTYTFDVTADSGTNQTIDSGNTLNIAGGTNISTVVGATDTVTVDLDDSITLAGELTVNGTGQSSFAGQVTIPTTPVASTDAASKAYVDASVAGGLIYQGGYNAATNTPDLDSSPSSNIKKGWTYTVTADGSFFTEQVRVGDVLIAEVDGPTSLADWTTVQNNIDLASLTQVGIGNVNAGTGISVTYSNGTATVSQDGTNQSAKRIDLNSTVNGVTRAEAGGVTTFTIDVSDANIFGGSTSALDVMVEVIGNAANAGDTVYAETGRSASNLTVSFTGSVANGDYQVLLNNVA